VTERDGIYRQIREKNAVLEASESELQKKEVAIQTRENDLEVLKNEWRNWLRLPG
jgi:FtsZ-binding cell division protein ZapB